MSAVGFGGEEGSFLGRRLSGEDFLVQPSLLLSTGAGTTVLVLIMDTEAEVKGFLSH
jgi:hypothetical protein